MSIKATVSVKPITITSRVQVSTKEVTGGVGGLETGKTLVRMSKKADFPSLGDSSRLYIDESDGVVYLWSDADLTYTPIASDWHQIKTINGGNA